MNNGVLLFANNNDQVDYVKQAIFLAKNIKKHMGCGVAIATDSPDYLNEQYKDHLDAVDHVIPIDWHVTQTNNYKRFRDGTMSGLGDGQFEVPLVSSIGCCSSLKSTPGNLQSSCIWHCSVTRARLQEPCKDAR